jgi:L-Ala-D/L-Glu epimerase / N-acetyl-D-glutamate racemase
LKLSYVAVDLRAKHDFKIANQAIAADVFRNVVVRLEHEGLTGWGEAAPFAIYGETQETAIAALQTLAPCIEQADDPWEAETLMDLLDSRLERNFAIKAALDMALYDLQGQLCGLPVYRMLGLSRSRIPLSTFSIGIDSPQMIRERVRQVKDCPLLKIKVGGPEDIETIRIVREEAPRTVIRVDANCGWQPRQALRMIEQMVELGVEYVEQPLPAANTEGARWLFERSPLPLMTDESCERLDDIPGCLGRFDSINIKLAKCGGIRHALKMIGCARAHNLTVMLGCMLETSIGVTAAAHIGPLVDCLDLDGAELTRNDPCLGMTFDNGTLILPDKPGLGVMMPETKGMEFSKV